MSALVFDTHDFVRRLHKVGFSEEQAEMVTKLQQEAVNASLELMHNAEVATKHDLKETELKLEIRIAEIQAKIAETKSELVRWVVAAGFLQTALITALLLKVSSGL
ncbi:coiled-coil domain-containing protein [Methyloprofundus sp.]|uniref:coiled-coil domain-containing protein n=1 Tax=Methyloprofundus sp. TaxID=2020875 RepID=UPI003D101066